jgi:hypothetical protein
MVFRRDAGRWREVAGSNDPGWRSADGGSGFVTAWGETPEGVSQVTVSYEGASETVRVVSRYYLAVFWGVPEGDFDPSALPQVAAS